MGELDTLCRRCGTPYPTITACAAAHDPNLIDVVVTCDHCGHTLNAFIYLDEMTVVTPPSEEQNHG
ncbi:hypothetical protein [Stutzerimonas stutzeri]|uniref:hypothetical protein n=1 Tax=Stutzerimonas stutzeri TaxID=316 RepID=UPI001BCE4C74|nr:hypothetical protein [Stutzerimonas stutzeri]